MSHPENGGYGVSCSSYLRFRKGRGGWREKEMDKRAEELFPPGRGGDRVRYQGQDGGSGRGEAEGCWHQSGTITPGLLAAAGV